MTPSTLNTLTYLFVSLQLISGLFCTYLFAKAGFACIQDRWSGTQGNRLQEYYAERARG